MLKQHQAKFKKMEEEFHDFCSFQERLQCNKDTYSSLTLEGKKMLMDLILQDSRSHEMVAIDVATKLGLTISNPDGD